MYRLDDLGISDTQVAEHKASGTGIPMTISRCESHRHTMIGLRAGDDLSRGRRSEAWPAGMCDDFEFRVRVVGRPLLRLGVNVTQTDVHAMA